MRNWWILGCLLALGLAVGGCDDNGGSTDPDAGGGPVPEGLGPLTFNNEAGEDVAPNLSNVGTRTAPAAGDPTETTFTVEVFGADAPAVGAVLDFFPNNMPTAGCEDPCVSVTADDMGMATVTVDANAWFSYRVNAGGMGASAIIETVEVNVAQDQEDELVAIPGALFQAALAFGGLSPQPDTVTLFGPIEDADGETLENAFVRVFDGAGNEIIGGANPTGVRIAYWPDAMEGVDPLPSPTLEFTGNLGLYAAANLPAGELRVEVYGILTEGGGAELIGCESVMALGGVTYLLTIGPLRADGPASCGS
jgi:hypothetical protein